MQCVTIFTAGDPVGQPRVKARNVRGRVFIYTPNSAEAWKDAIRKEVKLLDIKPTDNIWELEIIFLMPRPRSHYGTGKNKNKIKPKAPLYHESRPDFDNLEKAIGDALTATDKNPFGFWSDDSKVVKNSSVKFYDWRDMPGAWIILTPLERITYEQIESCRAIPEGSDIRRVDQLVPDNKKSSEEGTSPGNDDREELLLPRSKARRYRPKGHSVEPIETGQICGPSQGLRVPRSFLLKWAAQLTGLGTRSTL